MQFHVWPAKTGLGLIHLPIWKASASRLAATQSFKTVFVLPSHLGLVGRKHLPVQHASNPAAPSALYLRTGTPAHSFVPNHLKLTACHQACRPWVAVIATVCFSVCLRQGRGGAGLEAGTGAAGALDRHGALHPRQLAGEAPNAGVTTNDLRARRGRPGAWSVAVKQATVGHALRVAWTSQRLSRGPLAIAHASQVKLPARPQLADDS